MFEDILGKDKRYVKTNTWNLYINKEKCGVEVYNVSENDMGVVEGYIKNREIKVDGWADYMIKAPGQTSMIKVSLLRVNQHTLKFYLHAKGFI